MHNRRFRHLNHIPLVRGHLGTSRPHFTNKGKYACLSGGTRIGSEAGADILGGVGGGGVATMIKRKSHRRGEVTADNLKGLELIFGGGKRKQVGNMAQPGFYGKAKGFRCSNPFVLVTEGDLPAVGSRRKRSKDIKFAAFNKFRRIVDSINVYFYLVAIHRVSGSRDQPESRS